jgi:lipopolysaccharide transport protein LptA
MPAIVKYFICLALLVIGFKISSSELINYKNISIHADRVTLDDLTNQLALEGSLKIYFGNFVIAGKSALLDYKKESLLILGIPASIYSQDQKVNGKADRLIIDQNLSIEMTGNAELFSNNRSIFSQNITYKINTNE